MEPPVEIDPRLASLLGLIAGASCVVWLWLLSQSIQGRTVLPCEPRRPVPWGATAALPALMLVLFAIAGLFATERPNLAEATTLELVERIFFGAAMVAILTGVMLAVVTVASRATLQDLGLPRYVGELLRDCGIGTVTWLAALVPVFGLQAVLVQGLDNESAHPLIEMIIQDPSPLLLAVAFLSAVVVAPIFEELAFRLLLQGWLEKWEAGPRAPRLDRWPDPSGSTADPSASPVEGPQPATLPSEQESGVLEDSTSDTNRRLSPRGAFGLPRGVIPVLASSTLFAMAHVGHGPDPIALFFLALLLGYVYNRTHRVVPCIVTHMLFNAISLVSLLFMILTAK